MSQHKSLALVALLLSSTFSLEAIASILVGNPKLTVRVAPGSGLIFDQVVAQEAVPRADACPPVALDGGQPASVLGRSVDLPVQTCAMGLELGGLLTVQGRGTAGGSFTLNLAVADLVDDLDQAQVLFEDGESRHFLLELGAQDWVTATDLGLSTGQHVTVGAAHPLHDDLVLALEADSKLFEDLDADGVIDPAERAAGSLW